MRFILLPVIMLLTGCVSMGTYQKDLAQANSNINGLEATVKNLRLELELKKQNENKREVSEKKILDHSHKFNKFLVAWTSALLQKYVDSGYSNVNVNVKEFVFVDNFNGALVIFQIGTGSGLAGYKFLWAYTIFRKNPETLRWRALKTQFFNNVGIPFSLSPECKL